MVEISTSALSFKENNNVYELSFTGLTESDKENLFKELFTGQDILKYVDLYDMDLDEVKRFIKVNFDPEDLVDVDINPEITWSF